MSDKPRLVHLLREVDERFAQKKPGREVEETIFSRSEPTLFRTAARFGMWAVPAALLGFLAFELARTPEGELPTSEGPTAVSPTVNPDITPATSDTIYPSEPAATGSPRQSPAPPSLPQPTQTGKTNNSPQAPSPTPATHGRDRVRNLDLPMSGEVEESPPTGLLQPGPKGALKSGPTGVGSGAFSAAAKGGKNVPTMGGIQAGSKPSRSETRSDSRVESGSDKGAPSNESGGDDDSTNADAEVHVIGIYDAYGAKTGTEGTASVHIDKPGVHVLVLSAYSETAWTVTTGPGVTIKRVIATGYEEQTFLITPQGATVSTLDYETHGAFIGCGYEWPDTDPMSGCETPELLAQIEALLQVEPTSFHGCYAASAFVMNVDGSITSDCWTQGGYSLTGYP